MYVGVCPVGTSAVYLLGASEQRPGGVKALSVGSLLTRAVHLLEFLDLPSTKKHFDLRLDHWRLSGRRVPLRESVWNLIKGISGFSMLTDDHMDSAPHCVTPTYLADINANFLVQHPTSFYTSYATTHPQHHIAPQLLRTLLGEYLHNRLFSSTSSSVSLPSLSFPLVLLHRLMRGYKGGTVSENLTGTGLNVADWYENDGVVSTISQGHPFVCTACQQRLRRRRQGKTLSPIDPPSTFNPAMEVETAKQDNLRPATSPPSSHPTASVCFHCTLKIDAIDHGSTDTETAQSIAESEWERGVRRVSSDDGPVPLCSSPRSTFIPPPPISDTRGAWVSYEVSDVTHVGLVLHPPSISFQRAFFSHLWARIDAIDRHVDTGQ